MRLDLGLRLIIALMLTTTTSLFAQNTIGNRWLVWYPELGSTGDAPSAAFSIKAAENTLTHIVGSPAANRSNSFAIGNDIRGYVYYDDRVNRIIRVVDPLQQTVVGTYNYSANNIRDVHAFQAFYVAATNRHYMAVANLFGNLSLTAVAILDISNPNAIVFVKHIMLTGIVKQYSSPMPSPVSAGRVTGMLLSQSAYTSAGTTMFIAIDDGVKAGSAINITVNGVPNRHPGIYVKITDPLAPAPPTTVFETYYSSTYFLAPSDNIGTGGPHQLMYDQTNNRIYVSTEGAARILSFDGITGAPTNNVYAPSVNANSGGFHALNLNKAGTELFAGRSAPAGIGEDRVYKFLTQANKVTPTIINQAAVSPQLWAGSDPVIKGVNLTPDETYLYAISNSPAGVFLLDKNTLGSVQQAKKADGSNAVFSNLDPHTYAFTLHDYGDAPVSYGRVAHYLTNQNFIADRLCIGSSVDGDTIAQTNIFANGDDNAQTPKVNDEDGISPAIISTVSGLHIGMTGTYSITNIPVKNTTGTTANLLAWIDFNHNNTFETAEGTLTTVPNGAATVNLNWTVPADVTNGAYYLRMRLTHDPSITTSTPHSNVIAGGRVAFDGEAEDYYINPVIPVSGNLFNDANGNAVKFIVGEPNVDGTNVNGTTFYAYLVVNGIVIDRTPVLADGSFAFPGAPQRTNNVQVILGSNNVAIGAASTTINNVITNPPSNWIYTGESDNNTADALIDGKLIVDIVMAAVIQKNFGIERLPDSDPKLYFIASPAVNSFRTLNGAGTIPGPLSGSDPEDGILGETKTLAITSLPTGGNELWYNGIKITLGANGINPPSPSNPFIIANYDADLLQVRFTGLGSVNVIFEYAYIDAANKQDTSPATYEMAWAVVLSAKGFQLKARQTGEAVVLDWQTVTEQNTSHFTLQKSIDGLSYQSIGSVNAAGNSSTEKNYSLTDYSRVASTVYYRAVLIDADDRAMTSNTVFLNGKKPDQQLYIYPNPVKSQLNVMVQISDRQSPVIFQLLDVSGKIIWTKQYDLQKGNNYLSIYRTTETKGIYTLHCRFKNEVRQQKVVITD